MTIEQILEIVEKYKLRMPPTVFYELKADIVNFEEPTTMNDVVPRKVVERIIKSPRTQEQMLSMLNSIQSVTPQEPCDKCEVGNPCLYCKHEFEPQESEE